MKKLIFVILGLSLALTACGTQSTTAAAPVVTPVPASAVIAEGHLVPLKYATLAFQARGTVVEIPVKLGDTVKKGDVLARLDNSQPAEAQVVAAQQAYDSLLRNASGAHAQAWQAYMNAQVVRENAQKKWDDINLTDIETRIVDRQKDVDDRLVDLKKAQANFDKYKALGKTDANYKDTLDQLDHAQGDYDKAIKDLEATIRERDVPRANLDAALAAEAEAKHQVELSIDGPNADQLALVKAQLAAAQDALSYFTLTSPFDGTIMDVNLKIGDQVGPETWAVKLADISSWYVETSDLTELEVVKVALGQKVTFVPDALSDVKMSGLVEQISQAFLAQGGDILYKVKVKVDKIDPRLLWGMTVQVTFEPLK